MFLLFVIFSFSILQLADAITFEKIFQPVDPRITQLLDILYEWCKQCIMRQFNLSRVHECIQAPNEIEYITEQLLCV